MSDALIQAARDTLEALEKNRATQQEIETLCTLSREDGWWTCHKQVLDHLEHRVNASEDPAELGVLRQLATHLEKMASGRPTK